MKASSAVLAIGGSFFLVIYWLFQQPGGNTPPGPIGLPLLGYIPFMGSRPHLVLQRLAKVYGSVFSIRLGSQYVVVLDDLSAVKNVLSHETTGRKSQGENGYISLWKNCTSLLHIFWCYDLFKQEFQKHLTQDQMKNSNEYFKNTECLTKFEDYLISQTKFKHRIELKIGRRMSYDSLKDIFPDVKRKLEPHTEHQSTVSLLRKTIQYLSVKSGIQLAGNLHMLQSSINSEVQELKRNWCINMYHDFIYILMLHQKGNESSVKEKSFLSLLQEIDCQFKQTVVEWFLLTMATHKDVQEKFQKAIQTAKFSWPLTGYSRTNRYSRYFIHQMRPTLSYIEAVILELLRWRSPAPLICLGVTVNNIALDDYFIPKNSILVANFWSIQHNPKYWGEDADLYKPERFMIWKKNKTEECLISYFTGKRLTPRQCLVVTEVFFNIVTILHKFNVSLPAGRCPNLEGELYFGLRPQRQELILTLTD